MRDVHATDVKETVQMVKSAITPVTQGAPVQLVVRVVMSGKFVVQGAHLCANVTDVKAPVQMGNFVE